MIFFGLVFFHESIQKAPDERQKTVKYFFVTSRRYLCTKFDFPQIIPQKGMPFWGNNSQKVKICRGLYRGKAYLSGV